MSKDKSGEYLKNLLEKVSNEPSRYMSLDLSIIAKKLNEIIEQTNKNTERILRLYDILAGK